MFEPFERVIAITNIFMLYQIMLGNFNVSFTCVLDCQILQWQEKSNQTIPYISSWKINLLFHSHIQVNFFVVGKLILEPSLKLGSNLPKFGTQSEFLQLRGWRQVQSMTSVTEAECSGDSKIHTFTFTIVKMKI